MNLLPINLILLLITLLLIIVVIKFIVPIVRTRISGLMTWKRSCILAGLYLVGLILMVPILSMLPDKGNIKLVDDRVDMIGLSHSVISDFDYYNHLPTEESLDKQQGLYKISSQTFKVDTNKLSFLLYNPFIKGRIFVGQKEVDDGEIGISTYATAQLAGGIDFTKQMLPPTISFQKGTLSFKAPGHQRFEFKQFKNDFTIDQFKLQNFGNFIGMHTSFGEQVIYISVPKGMEIEQGMYSDDQIKVISGT